MWATPQSDFTWRNAGGLDSFVDIEELGRPEAGGHDCPYSLCRGPSRAWMGCRPRWTLVTVF
jgi:hypothetical protein